MKKFRTISVEETSNPSKAGFNRMVISNGKTTLYAFYDIVENKAGITDKMENLFFPENEDKVILFEHSRENWKLLARQLNKMRRHMNLSKLCFDKAQTSEAILGTI